MISFYDITNLKNYKDMFISYKYKRYNDSIVSCSNDKYRKFHNRILTIVFWDVSGFSRLCNDLKDTYQDHTLIDFLQEYYHEANRIIYKHNGIVDKFIGDGIMAYFGYNISDDGTISAINAINAAFNLQYSFNKIKSKWIKIWQNYFNDGIINIDIKCGINTDITLIGNIETETQNELSVFGSAVNFASRLEQKARGNQIIISETTKSKIDTLFNIKCISLDNNNIKSFENVYQCYEVIDKF